MQSTFLLFAISKKYYALPATQVQVVLPNLIKPNIHPSSSCDYLAGWLSYQDSKVPVIDLCMLHAKRPTKRLLSSRIILINYSTLTTDRFVLGLLAEKVIETVQVQSSSSIDQNFFNNTGSFPSSHMPNETPLQLFDIDKMLPDNINNLFSLE